MDAGQTSIVNFGSMSIGPELSQSAFQSVVDVAVQRALFSAAPMLNTSESSRSLNPLEAHLDARIDRLRDEAAEGDPQEYLRLFHLELDGLPEGVSGTIRFRLKANIGHRHFAMGDLPEAAKWLFDAFDEAPLDPRAIANRALAIWAAGDAPGAYRYGAAMVAKDPSNDALASYLPQIAAAADGIEDPLSDVPENLRGTEPLVVAETIFLRQRDRIPEWWDRARRGYAEYPDSKYLVVLSAFSDIDEITRDVRIQEFADPSSEQCERLIAAAEVLDRYSRSKALVLKNNFDDGQNALAAAMIGYHLAHEEAKAVELAGRIADEGLDHPHIVSQAAQVAISRVQPDLAYRLVQLLPDDPDVAFHAGILAVHEGKWEDACTLFARATVPESEQGLVDAFVSLAKIDSETGSVADLSQVLAEAWNSPRSLVLSSRVAARMGHQDIAGTTYERAKELIEPSSHITARLMVAGLAEHRGANDDVIELLDGKINYRGHPQELMWLAKAHAEEQPHRQRNLDFFKGLPSPLRDTGDVGRAYASVLLDMGEVVPARKLFERFYREHRCDSYIIMRLVEAYRREGNGSAVRTVLNEAEVRSDGSYPTNDMTLCAALVEAGHARRAYTAAFEIVKRHPDRADIALQYVGLDLAKGGGSEAFERAVAGRDAVITLESGSGASHTFIIDEGPDFYGMDVKHPDGDWARLVDGKTVDDEVDVPRPYGDAEKWRVKEVATKFLHLHRQIFTQFETRFPRMPGLVRFDPGDDLANVFTLVRNQAEATARAAREHINRGWPLSMAAALFGGDPISFAGYVRSLDLDIQTASGNYEDLVQAQRLAEGNRGKGVVLDAYTVWIVAELDLLDTLRDYFGRLVTPDSTLSMIDRMVARERDGMGTESMTIAWVDGQFMRHSPSDDDRNARIVLIENVRAKIVGACETTSAVLPDQISDLATRMLQLGGANALDAGLIASQLEVPLLSDDGHYRTWLTAAGIEHRGFWLQAALMALGNDDAISVDQYSNAIAGVALRRHSHVSFGAELLYKICIDDDDDFVRFRATLRYLAGPTAEMVAHYEVMHAFLRMAWSTNSDLDLSRRRVATGAVLDALLSGRKREGLWWLVHLLRWHRVGPFFGSYLRAWIRGHFIDLAFLTKSKPRPNRAERRKEKANRRRSARR